MKRFKGAKAKADKLFSEVVRMTSLCEASGFDETVCSSSLQCAHIISRRFNVTRTDTRNAFSLCASHHRFYTDHPRQFSKFITQTWAQQYYDSVYQKSRALGKVDWLERVEFLNRIKSGELNLIQARELED